MDPSLRDRRTFDAAAFVDDVLNLGCGISLMKPVPSGYGPGEFGYAIKPPLGHGTSEVIRAVVEPWTEAIGACPDHEMLVATHLIETAT